MTEKFLIAEMCQNHNGSWETLEEMIRAAARAGSTHAKIQGIYASELTYREEFEEEGGTSIYRPFAAEAGRLGPLELSEEHESRFVETCLGEGLVPMITVFTHAGLDRAIAAGFTSFKIASYDCGSRPLISKSLSNATEVFVSTGATKWSDVVKTASLLAKSAGSVDVRLLHATTLYPTPLDRVNLLRMLILERLGVPVGFSDHTSPQESGLIASSAAATLGATVIERHFTVLPKGATRDGPVSVNEEEMSSISRELMAGNSTRLQKISEVPEEVLEYRGLDPSPEEMLNAEYYRGRFASWNGNTQVPSWEEWV